MKTTIEQRKEKAVELMKQLQIYKPYINDFKKENLVTYFERHIGYWAFQDKELNNKIKQLEEKYDITIYTATHEFCEFGECYSFLYLPNDNEDWDYLLDPINSKQFYARAYVWNKDDDWCSEFGDISVFTALGGLRRIG